MAGVENLVICWPEEGGGAEFGTGEAISANLSTGEAIWAYLTVVFGQGVFLFQDLYICQVFS